MNYLLLPHELNKRHKIEDFDHLRITHKFYTYRSGREIPRIGRYGGIIWKVLVSGYGCTSRNLLGKEFWLAKALREQTIDANLDAKHIRHKH